MESGQIREASKPNRIDWQKYYETKEKKYESKLAAEVASYREMCDGVRAIDPELADELPDLEMEMKKRQDKTGIMSVEGWSERMASIVASVRDRLIVKHPHLFPKR